MKNLQAVIRLVPVLIFYFLISLMAGCETKGNREDRTGRSIPAANAAVAVSWQRENMLSTGSTVSKCWSMGERVMVSKNKYPKVNSPNMKILVKLREATYCCRTTAVKWPFGT
jgi:hypothetical protein